MTVGVQMIVIRGAVTCDNSKESIISAVGVLTDKIFELNDLNKDRLSAVIFSMTKDLAAYNAATAFRERGFVKVPLFCCQEADVENSLEKCIRVMIFAEGNDKKNVKHVYLGEAEKLRSDIL